MFVCGRMRSMYPGQTATSTLLLLCIFSCFASMTHAHMCVRMMLLLRPQRFVHQMMKAISLRASSFLSLSLKMLLKREREHAAQTRVFSSCLEGRIFVTNTACARLGDGAFQCST
uniref:Putative secreted protein n=1 Tax=Anopheles darlingi TaxID=43151 RepID=A0A2M4D7N4_ANODA